MRRSLSIRFALTFALLCLVVGVSHVSSDPAHAESNPIHDYFDGVAQLLPAVDAWQADLDAQLSAMIAKPELACGNDVAALARRGHGLVQDLRGTGELAPSMLKARHVAAVDALERAVQGLDEILAACDRDAGADLIEAATGDYADAIRLIRYYTARLG